MDEPRHCDEYIHDSSQPLALRWWLFLHRLPAADQVLCREAKVWPALLATLAVDEPTHGLLRGQVVRVVMASRFGDVGVTKDLSAEHGYTARLSLASLTDFRAPAQIELAL